ncbi:hypothetical protein HDU81_009079 [Chytriomyces hyalinus]|nr:hypothetical protein HDU81_009079 [Chytriomyces hyalinus]
MQLNPLQFLGSLQARFGSNQTVVAEPKKAPVADFMKEQRERPKAIMKELAELWKVAAESEREKYTAEAKELKQAYNKQMSTYQEESNLNDILLDQTRLQMERSIARAERDVERILDPQLPKRPDNAYVLFLKSENAYKKGAKGVQEGAAKWKDLSDFEKQPFLKSAEKLKKNYEMAMADRKKSTAATPGKVSLKGFSSAAVIKRVLKIWEKQKAGAPNNQLAKYKNMFSIAANASRSLPFAFGLCSRGFASSVNKTILLGHVGRTPEFRPFPDQLEGSPTRGVWSFTLATDHFSKKSGDTEWTKSVDWHTVKHFGSADKPMYAKKVVEKGTLVQVQGRMTYYRSEEKGRVYPRVIAEQVGAVSSKRVSGAAVASTSAGLAEQETGSEAASV